MRYEKNLFKNLNLSYYAQKVNQIKVDLNKTEKTKRHNLGNHNKKKPTRYNYQDAYKGASSNPTPIKPVTPATPNTNSRQNHIERKSSPMQKFTPKADGRDGFGSPKFVNESDTHSVPDNDQNAGWVKETKFRPSFTPSAYQKSM